MGLDKIKKEIWGDYVWGMIVEVFVCFMGGMYKLVLLVSSFVDVFFECDIFIFFLSD